MISKLWQGISSKNFQTHKNRLKYEKYSLVPSEKSSFKLNNVLLLLLLHFFSTIKTIVRLNVSSWIRSFWGTLFFSCLVFFSEWYFFLRILEIEHTLAFLLVSSLKPQYGRNKSWQMFLFSNRRCCCCCQGRSS